MLRKGSLRQQPLMVDGYDSSKISDASYYHLSQYFLLTNDNVIDKNLRDFVNEGFFVIKSTDGDGVLPWR